MRRISCIFRPLSGYMVILLPVLVCIGCQPEIRDTILDGVKAGTSQVATALITALFQSIGGTSS